MSTSVSDPVEKVSAAPSAQADRFVHERLPAREQLPRMVYALPELRIPAQANLVQSLFDKAFREGRADKPMLRSDKITLSYAEALERVNRIAQVLTEDFGLKPGNRVLLRGGNSIGMALAWLGVVQAGLVAVATMPLLRAKELGEIIEKARPALALCDATLLDELQAAKAQHLQLLEYRRDYQQRWSSQFAKGGTMEIINCYHGFVGRLAMAIEQQDQVTRRAQAQLEAVSQHLREKEIRVASIGKLIARRLAEAQHSAAKRDQKATDEMASRLAWNRIHGDAANQSASPF